MPRPSRRHGGPPTLGQRLAYGGAAAVVAGLKALPPDAASAVGGWTMAAVGPLLWRHRIARENLALVFPDMPAGERRRIAYAMWANFGRVAGEYPHLERIIADPSRIEIVGMDAARSALQGHQAALLLSAHYGNWEVASAAALAAGLTKANIYRRIDNPLLDRLVDPLRRVTAPGGMIAKDEATIPHLTHLLRKGISVGLLVDHRERRGLRLPFLGIDADTVHSPAILARRLGFPIIVARGLRTGGARFRVECVPIPVHISDDWRADVEAATLRINEVIGAWIRERPEQWYWVHRRWKSPRRQATAAAGAPPRQAAPSRH